MDRRSLVPLGRFNGIFREILSPFIRKTYAELFHGVSVDGLLHLPFFSYLFHSSITFFKFLKNVNIRQARKGYEQSAQKHKVFSQISAGYWHLMLH